MGAEDQATSSTAALPGVPAAGTKAGLKEFGDQASPAGLMGGVHAAAGGAMRVFVEPALNLL